MTQSSILVTGGAGFIGSHFIEAALSKDDPQCIVCLDSFNDFYSPTLKDRNVSGFHDNPRVTIVRDDIRNAKMLDELFERYRFERVMHLGAYAGVHFSVDNPGIYFRTNVEGTLNLLEAARRFPVKQFVLASSSTVYGQGADTPFSEDGRLGIPASPYGASKLAAEVLAWTYRSLHGVPVVCVRPFSVYGPRLRPDLAIAIFTRRILAGEEIFIYGDGSIRRDFTHVHDICNGLWTAMNNSSAIGGTYNLGHNDPIPISEIINLLELATGRKAKLTYTPERSEDLKVTHANLEAAEALGYCPRISIHEGIPEYVDWVLSQPSRDKS